MITTDEVVISSEDPRQPDVRALIADLDAMMVRLYPAESNHLVDVEALAGPGVRFLVARHGGRAVGCGAVVRLDEGLGEIKRMYVDPRQRRGGIGRLLLNALETETRKQGLQQLALETGISQAEAISLYRCSGFRECPPFGTYKPDPLSIFMTKELA